MVGARLPGRILATVAALALAIGTATASAADGRAAVAASVTEFEHALAEVERGTAYDELGPRERAALDARLLPAGHVVERANLRQAPARWTGDDPMAVLSWCFIGRVTYTAVAAAGNALYSYLVEGSWCSDGVTVDSAQHEWSSGEASGPGWTYHGVLDSGGGVAANEGRAWSRHRFTLRLGGITWQTNEPCVRMRGSAAGGLGHDNVCATS